LNIFVGEVLAMSEKHFQSPRQRMSRVVTSAHGIRFTMRATARDSICRTTCCASPERTKVLPMMNSDDVGLWCQIECTAAQNRAALFLDRDGVVVADTRYLGRPQDLHMMDRAASAIARCNALNIPVVLVTNQSGIARGFYDWDGFRAVQAALSAALAEAGAHFDAVLACAYHAEGAPPLRSVNHPWRKPNPGMIITAADRMGLDLSRSWIIGDSVSDIAAGAAARLAGGTLVATSGGLFREAQILANDRFVVESAPDLAAAVGRLIEAGRLARQDATGQ
jgi:D-glycero-D-manno-heptose 1,7-bisphosphate phosphatase